jgi:hypothetical protein
MVELIALTLFYADERLNRYGVSIIGTLLDMVEMSCCLNERTMQRWLEGTSIVGASAEGKVLKLLVNRKEQPMAQRYSWHEPDAAAGDKEGIEVVVGESAMEQPADGLLYSRVSKSTSSQSGCCTMSARVACNPIRVEI